jgi:hypothetical protein
MRIPIIIFLYDDAPSLSLSLSLSLSHPCT